MSNAGAIASMVAAGVSAVGSMNAANANAQSAYDTAHQLDQRAIQERAIAHREMERQKRQSKAQLSEQKTQLAASGFAADDPSSLAIVGETVEQQTLQEMLIKAQAEDSARQMEFEAKQLRRGGRADLKVARAQTLSSLGDAAVSWRDRYGGFTGGTTSGGTGTSNTRPRAG